MPFLLEFRDVLDRHHVAGDSGGPDRATHQLDDIMFFNHCLLLLLLLRRRRHLCLTTNLSPHNLKQRVRDASVQGSSHAKCISLSRSHLTLAAPSQPQVGSPGAPPIPPGGIAVNSEAWAQQLWRSVENACDCFSLLNVDKLQHFNLKEMGGGRRLHQWHCSLGLLVLGHIHSASERIVIWKKTNNNNARYNIRLSLWTPQDARLSHMTRHDKNEAHKLAKRKISRGCAPIQRNGELVNLQQILLYPKPVGGPRKVEVVSLALTIFRRGGNTPTVRLSK